MDLGGLVQTAKDPATWAQSVIVGTRWGPVTIDIPTGTSQVKKDDGSDWGPFLRWILQYLQLSVTIRTKFGVDVGPIDVKDF